MDLSLEVYIIFLVSAYNHAVTTAKIKDVPLDNMPNISCVHSAVGILLLAILPLPLTSTTLTQQLVPRKSAQFLSLRSAGPGFLRAFLTYTAVV